MANGSHSEQFYILTQMISRTQRFVFFNISADRTAPDIWDSRDVVGNILGVLMRSFCLYSVCILSRHLSPSKIICQFFQINFDIIEISIIHNYIQKV